MSEGEQDAELEMARTYLKPGEFKALAKTVREHRKLPIETEPVAASRADPDAFTINIEGRDVQVVAEDTRNAAEKCWDDNFGGGPVDPEAGLKVDLRAAVGVSLEAVRSLAECARALKAAELEHRACQERYAAAVRALSEEAVK